VYSGNFDDIKSGNRFGRKRIMSKGHAKHNFKVIALLFWWVIKYSVGRSTEKHLCSWLGAESEQFFVKVFCSESEESASGDAIGNQRALEDNAGSKKIAMIT